MLKNKIAYKKALKIAAAYGVMLSFAISAAGCGKPKVVEDYPVSAVGEGETVTVADDTPEEQALGALEFDKELYSKENGDSLRETGVFVYDPTRIPASYIDPSNYNPDKLAFARMLLQSVYEGRKEFYVPEEMKLGQLELEGFLASVSMINPLTQSVGVEKIEDNHYAIMYFPETIGYTESTQLVDDEYVAAQKQMFIDYVEETINTTVSKDDSDIEIAEKIYRKLIEDFEVIPIMDYYMGMETGEDKFGLKNESGVEDHFLSTLEMYNQKKVFDMRFSNLYYFFLDQLHIECYNVGSTGKYIEQDNAALNEAMQNTNSEGWVIIKADDKAYNCDIILDYYIYHDAKENDPNCEPELKYFGMSDATREEVWHATGGIYLNAWDSVREIPKCEEDLKKKKEDGNEETD